MKLIVIEGIDRSGKTTVINHIKNTHPSMCYLKEPYTYDFINCARNQCKSLNISVPQESMLCAFWATRFIMLKNIINLVAESPVAILDRYYPSTYVYQVDNSTAKIYWEMVKIADSIIKPHSFIYLYTDYATFLDRKRAITDNFEDEITEQKFNEYQTRYNDFFTISKSNVIKINTSKIEPYNEINEYMKTIM